ncbi:MAG: hypothetical protein M0C28_26190 [Candidatus Moduliflexus flocculans]|nr:hypothetical protein [Candidatus Moduliflexus flocculans]
MRAFWRSSFSGLQPAHRATEPRRCGDAHGAGSRGLRGAARRRAAPSRRPTAAALDVLSTKEGGRDRAARPHADDRGLGTRPCSRRGPACGRRAIRPAARDPSRAADPATAGPSATRARGRAAGRRLPARHPLARVPREPLPARPPGREPGVEGIRRRGDRSPRQHLRRPEGLREHALQPALRPAVRAGRTRSAVAREAPASVLAGLGGRRRARRSSATRWAATACSTCSARASPTQSVTGRRTRRRTGCCYERAASNPAYLEAGRPRASRRRSQSRRVGGRAGTWDRRRARAPSRRRCCSWPEAPTTSRGTRRRERARCSWARRVRIRYLLTFLDGSHNVGGADPRARPRRRPYSEALRAFPFMHYEDRRVGLGAVQQHPAALRHGVPRGPPQGRAPTRRRILDLVPRGSDGVYAVERDGRPKSDYTSREGFSPGRPPAHARAPRRRGSRRAVHGHGAARAAVSARTRTAHTT